MTRGTPAASTWATRLLVVPRSMPTMRDMRLCVLSQGLAQVIDDGAQVGPRGQTLLESIDEWLTVCSAVHRGIPLGRPLDHRHLLRALARLQAIPLRPQTLGRFSGQPLRLGLLERLLHFEHLREEVHGRLRLGRGLLADLPPFLERDHVFDAGEGVAQRPISAVDEGRGLEGGRLGESVRRLMEVRMVKSREVVEATLKLLEIQRIRQPRAASALDPQAQKDIVEVLVLQELLDLRARLLRQCQRHRFLSSYSFDAAPGASASALLHFSW